MLVSRKLLVVVALLQSVALVAAAAAASCSLQLSPAGDALELRNGFVRLVFNLTRGSADIVQGRLDGDGNFSASPNLAGATLAVPAGHRRGAVAVVVSGAAAGAPAANEPSTASVDRPAPAAFVVLANDTSAGCAFSVALDDSLGVLSAALSFRLVAAAPRALEVNATATATASFSPTVVSLSTLWSPPSATAFYSMPAPGAPLGVRQGMRQPGGLLASLRPLVRAYVIGDGATGALEVVPRALAPSGDAYSSWIFAGAANAYGTAGGVGAALWGAAQPADVWTADFSGGQTTAVPAGATSATVSLSLFPNDRPFPPSKVPAALPPRVVLDDLQATLQAAHGAVVGQLHSFDFSPEVRAAPCITVAGGNCYQDTWSYYDPDSGISNSALFWTFDDDLLEQARGQLETNIHMVCPDNAHPERCAAGQCIHHFVKSCDASPNCYCADNPNGQQDCVNYDSLAGGAQTGPNIFTALAALRYAGASGDLAWLSARMPVLRQMIEYLEPSFDAHAQLYNVPGSLQIDVFIRANYTADSNAMFIILLELFADAEAAVGNQTGVDFCTARVAALREGMNAWLLSADKSHYCTQSDPGAAPDSVNVCARDFVDYDANAIAVWARVPQSAEQANAVLARVDGGKCTHAGRATYVSEVFYDKSNCVGGNTGDSAVAMGRIGWQDAMARRAVGDAAAADVFSRVLLAPLQADLLRRTWLPERFTCDGQDTHNEYYFEYPAVVSLMLFEAKYGVEIAMTKVVVDPLAPPAGGFDLAVGFLHVGWSPTAFRFAIAGKHAGPRDFRVTRMAAGNYTVTPEGGTPFAASVPQGSSTLAFTAPVGAGHAVDAVLVPA